MAAIGGFRSDLSITRKTDGNFGNVSAGVLFSKVAYPRKGSVTLPGCRVSRDRQACLVILFCSSYLYISTKTTILIDSTYFLTI